MKWGRLNKTQKLEWKLNGHESNSRLYKENGDTKHPRMKLVERHAFESSDLLEPAVH